MAIISFNVQTDDGTTINISHAVSLTDNSLNLFLTAAGASHPGYSNSQLILGWVNNNMQNAVNYTYAYQQSQLTPPTPIDYTIIS
jgi:hypothetical protein